MEQGRSGGAKRPCLFYPIRNGSRTEVVGVVFVVWAAILAPAFAHRRSGVLLPVGVVGVFRVHVFESAIVAFKVDCHCVALVVVVCVYCTKYARHRQARSLAPRVSLGVHYAQRDNRNDDHGKHCGDDNGLHFTGSQVLVLWSRVVGLGQNDPACFTQSAPPSVGERDPKQSRRHSDCDDIH